VSQALQETDRVDMTAPDIRQAIHNVSREQYLQEATTHYDQQLVQLLMFRLVVYIILLWPQIKR